MSIKSFFKKYQLYFTDYEAYKNYKYEIKLKKSNVQLPNFLIDESKDYISFKHSGNIGDIIYALPSVFALAKGKKIHLYFGLDQIGVYGKKAHPLGNKTMSIQMIEMLSPLLLKQPNVTVCKALEENTLIDYDLDLFRKYPFTKQYGNIARWYFYVFAINVDLGHSWLNVNPNLDYANSIVIARSQRYNAPGVDYGFLNVYDNVYFVGVKAEYEIMKISIPTLQFVKVSHFLEMAEVIAGCKLFIGNQSFPFALAEALKVKRLLEVYHLCPNVIPEGKNGFDFCYQPQFEYLVQQQLTMK